MKITAVEPIVLEGRRDHPSGEIARHLVVKVTTDTGLIGWGEAFTAPEVIRLIIDTRYRNDRDSGLAALLIGEDPRDTDRLWAKMAEGTILLGRDGVAMHAMAAIDVALWDIKGKALGQPIHALLGGARRDRVDWYATHTLGKTIDDTVAIAERLVAGGCRAVKFGWLPAGQTPAEDEAIVAALRRAIGPDIRLLIDCGMHWNVDEALERTRRFAAHDIYWFEEALRAYDVEGYARLKRESGLKITAGEMAATSGELGRMIDADAVDVLQIELAQVGLTEAMKIAAHANAKGIAIVNHNYVLDINLAASLHMLAAVETIDLCETPGNRNEVRDALVRNPPRPGADGLIPIPQGPGLGIEIDEAAVRRFALTG
jgi:L-alanine-DL-glutamate epimerase-like enolase superfamily enzyme